MPPGYPWAQGDLLLANDLNAAINAASSAVAAGGPFLPLSGGTLTETAVVINGSAYTPMLSAALGDRVDVMNFGAVADGHSHPISTRYTSLAAAQEVYPFLTSTADLSKELDWAAMQAALNWADTFPAVPNLLGTGTAQGTEIWIPGGCILKTGTTTLISNQTTITIRGSDNQGSTILVEAAPWLQFGLNNQMSVQVAVVYSRGQGFSPGDQIILTDGTFVTPAVINVNSVTDGGAILATSIADPGNYSVFPPAGPLNYTDSGQGVGASFTGTFTGSGLTAITFVATGTGYTNGDVLTAVGGSAVGGTVTPATFTVTNAIAGSIQSGGVSVTSGGSYGTPPPNPVSVIGGTGSGALFNISNFTNRGGSLTLNSLHFVAAMPNAQILQAQFNLSFRSTEISNCKFDYLTVPNNCNWGTMLDLTSMTNAVFRDLEVINNLGQLPNNTCGMVVREQNNLLGHYGYLFENVTFGGGWQTGINFKLQDAPGFQGLWFYNTSVGPGNIAFLLENTSPATSYNTVYFHNSYDQCASFASITSCLGLYIHNCGLGVGSNRLATPPTSITKLYLYNCKQGLLTDCIFATAISTTPTVTFVNFDGPCNNWTLSGNHFGNQAKVPSCTAYVTSSLTGGISEINDQWATGIVPVVDNAPRGRNQFSASYTPGNLAIWGSPTTFTNATGFSRVIDGGANPVSAGMGGLAWYTSPWSIQSTPIPVTGRLYAAPIYIPNESTVRSIAHNVFTASAGNWQARMGIYTNAGGAHTRSAPGTLVPLSDTGNQAYTSASTGAISVTVNGATGVVLAPGWYWLAWVYDGASSPHLTCLAPGLGSLFGEFCGANSATSAFAGVSPSDYIAFSYTGVEALPTTFGTPAITNAAAPLLAISVS